MIACVANRSFVPRWQPRHSCARFSGCSDRIHAARDVVLVRRRLGGVTLDPLLRAAVTGLAADAVAELELRPALVARHVVGVTVETDLRGARARQAEVRGDALRLGELERAIRLRVPVLARPGLVLVQRDVLARLRARACRGRRRWRSTRRRDACSRQRRGSAAKRRSAAGCRLSQSQSRT